MTPARKPRASRSHRTLLSPALHLPVSALRTVSRPSHVGDRPRAIMLCNSDMLWAIWLRNVEILRRFAIGCSSLQQDSSDALGGEAELLLVAWAIEEVHTARLRGFAVEGEFGGDGFVGGVLEVDDGALLGLAEAGDENRFGGDGEGGELGGEIAGVDGGGDDAEGAVEGAAEAGAVGVGEFAGEGLDGEVDFVLADLGQRVGVVAGADEGQAEGGVVEGVAVLGVVVEGDAAPCSCRCVPSARTQLRAGCSWSRLVSRVMEPKGMS